MFIVFCLLPPLECNVNMHRDLICLLTVIGHIPQKADLRQRLACKMFIRE